MVVNELVITALFTERCLWGTCVIEIITQMKVNGPVQYVFQRRVWAMKIYN